MTEATIAKKNNGNLVKDEQVQYVNELTTLNLGPTHPPTLQRCGAAQGACVAGLFSLGRRTVGE